MPRTGRARHDNPSCHTAAIIEGISEPWQAQESLMWLSVVFRHERIHAQVIAVRDCADRNGRRWDFGAVSRCRGSWRRSRRMLP